MNFKEQMQEKAKAYDDKFYGDDDYEGFLEGSKAALSSDLVKGLVDALEQITDDPQFEKFCLKCKRMGNTALANYKQEVKQ